MSDIIDRANDLAQKFQDKSLAEHKEKTRHKYPYDINEGDFDCYECGEIIPVARRQLTGSELCIDCKSDLDERNSRI
jgi:phage/conjugal plasmid C-4 type zinc finger TraR family protein